MRNFQDTFETRKRAFISDFSICVTVPLRKMFQNDSVKFSGAAAGVAQAVRPAVIWKRDSNAGVFLSILRYVEKHLRATVSVSNEKI